LTGKTIVFLALAFLAIYSPFQLGMWELRWQEGRHAAIALEIDQSHPNTIAHGEQIPYAHPVFPLLASFLHRAGLPIESALRLVSVLSVALLTVLAWEAGKRAKDIQTAAVAAAMAFSSLVVVEKAMDGYPDFTSTLFIVSAWLSWFTFGMARGQWNRAWIISFTFCAMAFHVGGWRSVALFLCPLFFMRRPLTVWQKLRKPGFAIGVMLLAASMLFWALPRWMAENETPFRASDMFASDASGYFKHLLTFPFEVLLRFLPWSILAWPAFCVAYFPLDKNPIFSRFLRTIVISIFFLLWLTPFFDPPRSVAVLAFPLAVLCGMNYWLLIRRHGRWLHGVLRHISYGCAALAAGGVVFYLLPVEWLEKIPYLEGRVGFHDHNFVAGVVQALAALLLALTAAHLSKNNRSRIFEHVLCVSVALALCFWSLHAPYRAMKCEKKRLGYAIATTLKKDLGISQDAPLPDDLRLYKGPGIVGLYAPCVYTGAQVKKIHSLDALPVDKEVVYMLALEFPVSGNRSWEYLSPKNPPRDENDPLSYKYKNKRVHFHLLRGRLIGKRSE